MEKTVSFLFSSLLNFEQMKISLRVNVLFLIGFQEEEESKEVVLRRLEESVNAHPDDPSLHFDLVFSSLFNLIGLSNSLFIFFFLSLSTNFSSKIK